MNASAGLEKISNASKLHRTLLWLFAIPFLGRLVFRLAFEIQGFYQVHSIGVAEWLVNYPGIFIRRGLPGTILYQATKLTGIWPGIIAGTASILLYIALSIYLFRTTKGIIPRWMLLTTPFLGFPVYLNDVLLRKDILVLCLFFISLELARRRSVASLIGVSAVLSAGVLSHEIIFFFGVPSLAAFLLISGSKKSSLLALIAPAASFAAVLNASGKADYPQLIIQSWKDILNPSEHHLIPFSTIPEIGKATAQHQRQTLQLLTSSIHGIPFWAIVCLTTAAGIALITISLAKHNEETATVFLGWSCFQLVTMSPIFLFGKDQGRWIVILLLSATILAIQTMPTGDQIPIRASPAMNGLMRNARDRFSWLIIAAGWSIWGMPHFNWDLYSWATTTPLGQVAIVYSHLRNQGFP